MTAEEAAHIAYVETLRGKHIVVPGFLNRLYVFLAQLPQSTGPQHYSLHQPPARSKPHVTRSLSHFRAEGARRAGEGWSLSVLDRFHGEILD